MTVPKLNFKKLRFFLTISLSIVIIIFLGQIAPPLSPPPQIAGISVTSKLLPIIGGAEVNALASSPYQDISGNVVISGNVGIGVPNPSSKIEVAGGDLKVSGFRVPGVVATAQQTSNVTATGQTWVDVPGATLTFSLPTTKTVNLRAYGSVGGSTTGTDKTYTHCGFRFVVDGTVYGHPSWGDQIVGVNKSSAGAPGWWTAWYIERDLDSMATGSHTAKLQITGWLDSTVGCTLSTGEFSAARLRIEAR